METLADKIIDFNLGLAGPDCLPANLRFMNPFTPGSSGMHPAVSFYKKYYSDNNERVMIIGINPGRFGAGHTGIPFTDPKRLKEICRIDYGGPITHEPSSVFIYEMIAAYGGPVQFYSDFYITSICPLGLVVKSINGKEKNYNYYDSNALVESLEPFMIQSMAQQLNFGFMRDVAFCFGSGKNEKYINRLNEEQHFFQKLISLPHPRFIMQYHYKERTRYIDLYLRSFAEGKNYSSGSSSGASSSGSSSVSR